MNKKTIVSAGLIFLLTTFLSSAAGTVPVTYLFSGTLDYYNSETGGQADLPPELAFHAASGSFIYGSFTYDSQSGADPTFPYLADWQIIVGQALFYSAGVNSGYDVHTLQDSVVMRREATDSSLPYPPDWFRAHDFYMRLDFSPDALENIPKHGEPCACPSNHRELPDYLPTDEFLTGIIGFGDGYSNFSRLSATIDHLLRNPDPCARVRHICVDGFGIGIGGHCDHASAAAVNPHHSKPNTWSKNGNVNPCTGKKGTVDPAMVRKYK